MMTFGHHSYERLVSTCCLKHAIGAFRVDVSGICREQTGAKKAGNTTHGRSLSLGRLGSTQTNKFVLGKSGVVRKTKEAVGMIWKKVTGSVV